MESREKLLEARDAAIEDVTQRSYREWFNGLPEPFCSQAIENLEKDDIQMNRPVATSLSNALIFAFSWNKTPEGAKYWIDVMKKYGKK